MHKRCAISVILTGFLLTPVAAHAHCDTVDGPVATAAVKALEMGNVHLMFPYVPQAAEAEIKSAFEQASDVRPLGDKARALADHYFMETAVRLHRAGEGAPYTGLQPAGTDFGPAIPAAERTLQSGELQPLVDLLSREIEVSVSERLAHARARQSAPKEPHNAAQVPAARERASAELAFIGHIEGIYLAAKGGGHSNGETAPGSHVLHNKITDVGCTPTSGR
jgi:hypothetical protein